MTEVITTAGVDISELDKLAAHKRYEPTPAPSIETPSNSTRFSVTSNNSDEIFNTDDVEKVIEYVDFHRKLKDTTPQCDEKSPRDEKSGMFWIDCYDCSATEAESICKTMFGGLHPLTLDLLESGGARSLYIFQEVELYHFARFGDDIAIILFNGGIISISPERNSLRQDAQRRVKNSIPFSPEWICYALLKKATRMLLTEVRRMDQNSRWVNDRVYLEFDATNGKYLLAKLAETRENLVSLIQEIRGKLEVTEALSRRCAGQDVGHYFDDVKDSLFSMKHQLEAHENLLGNTHRNWMAVTQMIFEKTKSKVILVIGVFLAIATVFIPMITVYTSGHMNLLGPGMGTDSKNLDRWGAINGITIGVAIIVVLIAVKFFLYIMRKPAPSLTD